MTLTEEEKRKKTVSLLNSRSYPVYKSDIVDGKVYKVKTDWCPLIRDYCRTDCVCWQKATVDRFDVIHDGFCKEFSE